MDKIHPDSFAMICFLVLMQNNSGLIMKSPDYITEKASMLSMGYTAFAMLDINNMRKVVDWLTRWKIEIPEVIAREYKLQVDARAKMLAEPY